MVENEPVRSLTLAHVLVPALGNLEDVLLIRHPISNPLVRRAVDSGELLQYTRSQSATFKGSQPWWIVFLGEESNSARFVECYANGGRHEGNDFDLQPTEILEDLRGRLVIDWGARSWAQRGHRAATKLVLAILDRPVDPFPGFDHIVLSFAQLEAVIAEPRRYAQWHAALEAVNAVYLITNTATGHQYVGSAYGGSGLLGRWRAYVETRHGGNALMMSELKASPQSFEDFQFSVLRVLEKAATWEEAVAVEALFKRKLLTKRFGMNAN